MDTALEKALSVERWADLILERANGRGRAAMLTRLGGSTGADRATMSLNRILIRNPRAASADGRDGEMNTRICIRVIMREAQADRPDLRRRLTYRRSVNESSDTMALTTVGVRRSYNFIC